MIKIQVNLIPPALDSINKVLVSLQQQPLPVDLRQNQIKQFNTIFPDPTCRQHVIAQVYAMGLPESLADLSYMLSCTPLVISQSFHVYTVSLLDLQSRLKMFQSNKHYSSITAQLEVNLNRI